MAGDKSEGVAQPLSRYAPYRRAGDLVYFSGIIAVDPALGRIVKGYEDIPEDARTWIGATGEMSTDAKDGPIAAQSWYVLDSLRKTIAAAGGSLDDVVKLTQYFRTLRDSFECADGRVDAAGDDFLGALDQLLGFASVHVPVRVREVRVREVRVKEVRVRSV